MKCEPCQTYIFSKKAKCSNCGSEGNEVDLANEAAEAAIRSRSHIEFIDDPFLDDLGGIAALLRW
jgi:peptide subunit release factor 1 (eRF1)